MRWRTGNNRRRAKAAKQGRPWVISEEVALEAFREWVEDIDAARAQIAAVTGFGPQPLPPPPLHSFSIGGPPFGAHQGRYLDAMR